MKHTIPAVRRLAQRHNITSIRDLIGLARQGGFKGRDSAVRDLLRGETISVDARGRSGQNMADFISAVGLATERKPRSFEASEAPGCLPLFAGAGEPVDKATDSVFPELTNYIKFFSARIVHTDPCKHEHDDGEWVLLSLKFSGEE
jgi:hypothetical protein